MKTNIRTIGVAAAASLALMLTTAACGDSNGSITNPTPQTRPEPAPAATFSVSGTIVEATESGNMPVEGAWVVNWVTEQSTITDSNGAYTLSGQHAGLAQLVVAKEGYEDQMIEVMIEGDMQLDAVLIREPAESN